MIKNNSTIPKGWKETTLGEVAVVNKLMIDKNYTPKEIEYIDVASVEKRRLLQTQKMELNKAPSRAKRVVENNNILISTVRPNLKHYCFIKKAKPNLIASTGFAVIGSQKDKSDPFFLYNLLTTTEYTNFLIKIANTQTSTYPAFNPSVIVNSKILLPPLPEQKAIAAVLSSLDDKVELLREENKTLESIAQTIFKEWFVKFNFSDENGKPYKDNGGQMINSELGEIPEGWKVGKIKDKIKTILGGTPSRNNKSYWENGTISWINSGAINDFPIMRASEYITETGLKNSAAEPMPPRTVVLPFVITPGSDIKISILGIKSTGNQSVLGLLETKKISSGYLYSWIQNMKNILYANATGGAQQHINKREVDDLILLLPKENILEKYNILSNPVIDNILQNASQIQTLSSIRDTLLPKLMKGEIRVRGFKG